MRILINALFRISLTSVGCDGSVDSADSEKSKYQHRQDPHPNVFTLNLIRMNN